MDPPLHPAPRQTASRELGEAEIADFLTHLAVEGHVASATQSQALNALVFLYREVLGRQLPDLSSIVRPKRPARLPVVLTPGEVFEPGELVEKLAALVPPPRFHLEMKVRARRRARTTSLTFSAELVSGAQPVSR